MMHELLINDMFTLKFISLIKSLINEEQSCDLNEAMINLMRKIVFNSC